MAKVQTKFATSTVQRIRLVLTAIPGSLLVVHQFAEKAKQEIRDKQSKKAKKAKDKREPEAEFLAARYLREDGTECVPVTVIKKACVTAGTAMDNLTKVAIRQALFVAPADDPSSPLVPIQSGDGGNAVGTIREDPVTIGQGTRDLRYRPQYDNWKLEIIVEYNSVLISRDQLIALVQSAGWGVGLCEGRPEKKSALGWGRFELSEAEDLD